MEVNQTERYYGTSVFPYMCAAFNIEDGITVNILVYIAGVGWRSIAVTQPHEVNFDYNYPTVASFRWREDGLNDGHWHYRCINLHEQLLQSIPRCAAFALFTGCASLTCDGRQPHHVQHLCGDLSLERRLFDVQLRGVFP